MPEEKRNEERRREEGSEGEVELSVKIPKSLREKIWNYTQKEGLKIKFFVGNLLQKFFTGKDRKKQ